MKQLVILFLMFGSLTIAGCEYTSPQSNSCLSYTQETPGESVGIGSASFGGSSVAESFNTGSNTLTVSSVNVKLQMTGTIPNGNTLTATIEGDTGSGPNNNPVQISGPLLIQSISAVSPNSYKFTFSNPGQLSASTVYWIRLKPTYPVSSTNYVRWLGHNGAAGKLDGGNAAYETASPNTFSTALIGLLMNLEFSFGC